MQNPVKLPVHLRSVPDWQRYMYCCSTLPMLVIMKAKGEGLFLKEYNRDSYPVPAIFLAIEK
jgi:RNA polymerase sigma-70 factor (ECF subfamily)